MLLPVLPSPRQAISGDGGHVGPEVAELSEALRAGVRGQVRFGDHDRALYATDASIYQELPLGVVVAADADDLAAAVSVCYARGAPMLPRGGGTSLAGQCTSRAVVLDTSACLRDVREIDAAARTLYAGAGVAIDEINNELIRRGHRLQYMPDPATTAQATVGGTIGNNASGSRSVKYGRTVDNVAAIDCVLTSGARVRCEPGAGARDAVALKLAEGVIRIVRVHEADIRARYPKTLRRNAGYALDMILAQLDAGADARTLDLCPLLCGSEGTLALTLGARLKLHPMPLAKGLALLSFASVDEAIAMVRPILGTGPSAVELVDDVVIEAALNNLECAKYVQAFPRITMNGEARPPTAVLYVEYHITDEDGIRGAGVPPAAEGLESRFAALHALSPDIPTRLVTDALGMADAWKLRKAGEPLLHGLPGARKPLTFVEDNAVPVPVLGEFVRRFRAIVEREGTRAAFWAHASVGVLHVRPMLDPRSLPDRAALLRIAAEVADLARACGGVMSGEHGDGKVRGPFLERFYGPALMQAFRDVKALFDPKGLLNPGNIVAPGPVPSILERTRIDPTPQGPRVHAPAVETYFNYDAEEGFDHAVERCNGAGVCRKQSGGTMCPSYRATLDERHSTRGRGNALRLAITGQLAPPAAAGAHLPIAPRWSDSETIKTLDLCLSCKACKSECPSNVDLAKLKSEYTAQRYRTTGVPLAALLVGHVRTLNRIGSLMPRLANAGNRLAPLRWVINRVMKLHPQRSLPPFSASLYRLWKARSTSPSLPRPLVVLFPDCFTTYNESHLGLAARTALEALGYDVVLPHAGCCGRAMISVGMLPRAIATIDSTLAHLRAAMADPRVVALVAVEPSCLSAIKDDWLTLKCATPLDERLALAGRAFLVEEFIDRHWAEHPAQDVTARIDAAAKAPTAPPRAALLHAHCHQKALWGDASSARALRRVLGASLQVLPTGCCGMAGSFGFGAEKFDLSMRIANLKGDGDQPGGGVMPFLERAPEASVIAPGTSCRHQIHDASGGRRHAVHPIEVLAAALTRAAADAAPPAPSAHAGAQA
ncbi:FAD-binding and (Fe-S)-binding domain-containing protein [soil metagenome]